MQIELIFTFVETYSLCCTFSGLIFDTHIFTHSVFEGEQKCNFYINHTGLNFNCKIQPRQKMQSYNCHLHNAVSMRISFCVTI